MADDKVAEAVDIVARQLVYAVVDAADDEWGNYPEIGEFDWLEVERRVAEIVHGLRPDSELFSAAYEFLERRADNGAVDVATETGGTVRLVPKMVWVDGTGMVPVEEVDLP